MSVDRPNGVLLVVLPVTLAVGSFQSMALFAALGMPWQVTCRGAGALIAVLGLGHVVGSSVVAVRIFKEQVQRPRRALGILVGIGAGLGLWHLLRLVLTAPHYADGWRGAGFCQQHLLWSPLWVAAAVLVAVPMVRR